MMPRRKILPFRDGQRRVEERRALEGQKQYSPETLREKKKALETYKNVVLEGGRKAKDSYLVQTLEAAEWKFGKGNYRVRQIMREVNDAYKAIASPEEFRKAVSDILKAHGVL